MDRPLLNDKSEYPSDEVLLRCLGKTKAVWDAFAKEISTTFAPMTLEWNYYRDGKAWLCKLVHKKKTMCWISVWPKFFKVGFYFAEKNNKDIKGLSIAPELKAQYASEKGPGTLKPLRIDVKTKKALASVFELIRYKSTKK